MKRIQLFMICSSLFSFILCLFNFHNINNALIATMFFPLVYLVCFLFLFNALKKKTQSLHITIWVFLGLEWIRYVLLPAISSASGFYKGTYDLANDTTCQLASLLLIFEIIITTIFCYGLLFVFKIDRSRQWTYTLTGNITIYSLFVAAMMVLFIVRGRGMFTFLKLSANVDSRASLSDRNLILQALIEYGMTFLIIIVLYYCYNYYLKTNKKEYVWIALIVSSIRISIISTESESRMAILYSIGVLLLILPWLFPNNNRSIYSAIIIIGVIVVGLLTIYKTFRAFQYDSYYEAISNNETITDLSSVAYTIDSYFYGVKDISRNIFISNFIDLSYKNIIADIVQNIFGLKYLVPSTGNTTLGAYNFFIYNGSRISGHLFSSIAYGYVYFTWVLAPLVTCINIFVVALLENIIYRIKSLDVLYIVSLVFVRCSAMMFACFTFGLNYLARTLIIGSVVVGGASFFNKNDK